MGIETLTPPVLAERIKALDERIDQRFIGLDQALRLRATEIERRFLQLEDWRLSVSDKISATGGRDHGFFIAWGVVVIIVTLLGAHFIK